MSWEKGNQDGRNKFPNINKEILAIEDEYLEEDQAKLLLYKFLRQNPSFFSEMITGVELFPFQHMAIKAMMETDYFLGIWCLDKDEYVLTEKGHKKIKDIKIGERVRSREGLNLVTDKWENPEQDGFEVTTKSGDSFKAKVGHKVLTYNENGSFEFKLIQELKDGDSIPIKLNTNTWGDKDITENSEINRSLYLYYMFGYVLGDGWVNQDGINYCTENMEVHETILKFSRRNDLKSCARQRSENLMFYEYSFYNREFVKWLESIGWDKSLKSRDKIIPDSLLQAPRDEICSMIGGLFDADGYASFLDTNSKVGLKNTSIEMLRQVKMLLNNMGIESNLRKSGEHESGPYYDLVISNDYDSLTHR